jgi:hypothetical protein
MKRPTTETASLDNPDIRTSGHPDIRTSGHPDIIFRLNPVVGQDSRMSPPHFPFFLFS